MKTKWDYTNLANAYLKRPDYSRQAIEQLLKMAGVFSGGMACDIGAGAGHLTVMLLEHGLKIVAIEPNDVMRANGVKRTLQYANVVWVEGVAEDTGQTDSLFDLITFGSSFNVADRKLALIEGARILKPGGWFACLWNYRDLSDPIQSKIEDMIRSYISDYNYGLRREDQTAVIETSGLFGKVYKIEDTIFHKQSKEDCLEAWCSHATLYRQAGNCFNVIISDIEKILSNISSSEITVPYKTCIWLAQVNKLGSI